MTRSGLLVLIAALTMTGCAKPMSPAEQARSDAKAIAMVEAAQDAKPPPVPLDPQPITSADIEQNKLYGAGCTLVPSTMPGGDPVVVANAQRAILKLGGKFVIFAADVGSAELGGGVRTHYVGRAQSLVLQKATGDGTQLGQEGLRWDGSVTLRDANDQLVYASAGPLTCSS